MRASGAPPPSTVARVIASASGTSAAARSNQRSNCANGSARRSLAWSGGKVRRSVIGKLLADFGPGYPWTKHADMADAMHDETITFTAAEVDGFFAADSMVRHLHSERVVLFSGARALLMQACEPLG